MLAEESFSWSGVDTFVAALFFFAFYAFIMWLLNRDR